MIEFSRYPHVKDFIEHYSNALSRDKIQSILSTGISTEEDAEVFSRFIWEMVGQMNEDEDSGIEVLGSLDNSDIIPDISYEITKLMRASGFFYVWEKVSDEESS